jgi:sulfate/thiosulfate transport system substrate-binding protein
MKHPRLAGVALLGAASLLIAACGSGGSGSSAGSSSGGGGKVTLSLVAYSTPESAYTKIIKAFQATPAGKNVSFTTSYGASGDQSRAVASGLPADVVAFALTPDITRLVKAGLVAPNWADNQYKGIVTDSVVVIGVRKGNPKNITGWADLTKPGIQVITPNPFSSGGARWNIMAAYGANSSNGTDQAAGTSYLKALFKNVPVQDSSARKSIQTFVSGKGDAFLSYESEAINAQLNGSAVDYVVPSSTILIETPVAVTSDSKHPAQAKAFVNFLYTPTAQEIFAKAGYRPIVPGTAGPSYPKPADLFTIADFGGWTKVTTQFFDPTNGIMAKIEQSIGVSVGS